jgi:hypothetical protein
MGKIMQQVRAYRSWVAPLAFMLAGAHSAPGQPTLQAENLLIAQPSGFKVGNQASSGNSEISEWVPAGETVEDWTQMLTVQVFHHSTVDPATFLRGIGKRWADACPGSSAKGVFTGQVNHYVVSMLVLRCPKNPTSGKPETTAFRAIKGKDALYSVQRAFRSEPSDKDLDAVMHYLGNVSVCDTRTADHPCPSLDSLAPSK